MVKSERKLGTSGWKTGGVQRKCFECGKLRHIAKVVPRALQWKLRDGQMETFIRIILSHMEEMMPSFFSCGNKGHIVMMCPSKSLFTMGDRQVWFPNAVTRNNKRGGDIYCTGIVEGITVKDILLDTGCSHSLVLAKVGVGPVA